MVSKGNLRRVWTLGEDGEAEPREIRTGLGDDEFVEVSGGGLEEGAAIIVGYKREP